MKIEDFFDRLVAVELSCRKRDELWTGCPDRKGFEKDWEPFFGVGFVHFKDPSSRSNCRIGRISNSSSIELKGSKFIVKFSDHMIVEFLSGVGIRVDPEHPTYCSDISGRNGVVTEPDVRRSEVGMDSGMGLELLNAQGGS